MTPTHTPGPWSVQTVLLPGKEHADVFVIQSPGVSLLHMNGPCLMYANAEADARLIAAAPDLLEVARQVAGLYLSNVVDDPRDPTHGVAKLARAAILAATAPVDGKEG